MTLGIPGGRFGCSERNGGGGGNLPFYNIPKNASGFRNSFSYITNPQQRKALDLTIKANRLFEEGSDQIQTKGSFLYHDSLVYVKSVKRGSGYYFYPTDTMKKPLREGTVNKRLLNKIKGLGFNRGVEGAIFWEFFSKPGTVWTSALSQAYALELFSKHRNYRDICEQIVTSLGTDWRQGGVFDSEQDWFLEYPMYIEEGIPDLRRVLNCQCDVITALKRYIDKTGSKRASELLKIGLASLRERLHLFIYSDGKTGYSIWQATHRDPAERAKAYNERYHNLHVSLVYRMYTITKDDYYLAKVGDMRAVPNSNPYYLTPHTVEIMEHRIPEKCCPNCKLPDVRCADCHV